MDVQIEVKAMGYTLTRSGCQFRSTRITGRSLAVAISIYGAVFSVFLTAGLSSAAPAAAKHASASPATSVHETSQKWTNQIVQLTGESHTLTQSELRSLSAIHADIYRHLDLINSIAVRIPQDKLNDLKALPFVKGVSSDEVTRKTDMFTVGSSGAATAQQQFGVDGTGVTVAVIDSGIHAGAQDLKLNGKSQQILAQVSFVPGDNGTDDKCGHGTHVAGIIAGNGHSSSGKNCTKTFDGIADGVYLVNVRVLDAYGQGTVSSVIAGIQWTVQNAAKFKIRIINLSLGHPVNVPSASDPLCQACEAAWKSGIFVVCAAGNSGRLTNAATTGLDNEGYGTAYGSIESPGDDPYVMTVGATKSIDGVRADDRITTYSSRGPTRLDLVLKPDIVAPGNQVISIDVHDSYLDKYNGGTNRIPVSYYQSTKNLTQTSDQYFRLSGTSMATPVVAAAAALMLQADPSLTPDTLKLRLMLSADKWCLSNGISDPCTFGAGYLNIPAALSNRAIATSSLTSPSLSADAYGNVYIDMSRVVWGKTWSGGGPITDLRVIWGRAAIAGTNTLSASRVVWGKSVWADTSTWTTDSASVDLSSIAILGE